MSDRNDDGHSPYTCNWIKCGATEATVPCPFVRQETVSDESGTYCSDPDCRDKNVPHWHQEVPHGHRYTVPVEWVDCEVQLETLDGSAGPRGTRRTVTKLRCEWCVSEVERP